jgi:hypothetical protein
MQLIAALALSALILSGQTAKEYSFSRSLVIVNRTPFRFDTISATVDYDAVKDGDDIHAEHIPIGLGAMNVMYPGQVVSVRFDRRAGCTLDLDALTPDGLRFSSRINVCARPAVWIIRDPNPPA